MIIQHQKKEEKIRVHFLRVPFRGEGEKIFLSRPEIQVAVEISCSWDASRKPKGDYIYCKTLDLAYIIKRLMHPAWGPRLEINDNFFGVHLIAITPEETIRMYLQRDERIEPVILQ